MNLAIGPGVNVAQLAASEAELRGEGAKADGPVVCPAIKPQAKKKRAPEPEAQPVVVVAAGDQSVAAAES
jgi:hypothetical protein